MSVEPNDPLEQSLQGLDWWPGRAPGLWKKALRVAGRESRSGGAGRLARVLRSPWPWVGVPIAAVIAVAIGVSMQRQSYRSACAANIAGIGKGLHTYAGDFLMGMPVGLGDSQADATGRLWAFTRSGGSTPPSFICPSTGDSTGTTVDNYGDSNSDGMPDQGRSYFKLQVAGRPAYMQPKQFICPSAQNLPNHETAPAPGDRHVIHKAAIDLQAEDVRAVYLKIQTLLPNEALGEYVEQAQIHDSGGQLNAYVTLRVRAERLSETMDALRALGSVVHEQSDASDVTAQVVDIDARLRNERRVEEELLNLLEKRKDAPLDEVLKVSQSLAEVRGRIESLTADQQRIARQVALASIVVTVGPKGKQQPETGLGHRFRERLGTGWSGGLSFLIESVAVILQVVIGGLIWWVLLIAIVLVLRRWYMRRTTQ